MVIFICKRCHFTKSVSDSHSFATVKWCWSFDAQIALVPALLSSTGKPVCFDESFLSIQADIQSFLSIFSLFKAFIVFSWHQTLVQQQAKWDGVARIKISKHLICTRPN